MTTHSRYRLTLKLAITILVLAVISLRFPLFHIIPLKQVAAATAAAKFAPAAFAETFWTNKLLAAIPQKAVPADKLIEAIQSNPATARTNFSLNAGASTYYYFLTGTGRVTTVTDDEISLSITSTNPVISLQTGLIFGNALRDGTGLLNVSDYPNSQDYNAISEALNHIVETRVLPNLRQQAKVGTTISFTGCAEIDDESTDLKPLKVIPIKTEAR
jgi:predicted lipoprotein